MDYKEGIMDLVITKQVLGTIKAPIASQQWDQQVATAVQRALAEIYLLNPYDDVDGEVGPRTRDAWKLFKQFSNQGTSDSIENGSANQLLQVLEHPAGFIGQAKVDFQPDFEYRRKQRQANREKSVPAIIAAAKTRQLTKAQIAYILATAEHESDSFSTLEEYDSGDRYEKRSDLGNNQKGDGPFFKGRGYVQLTGRRNYANYTDITGINLVRLPYILMNWPALAVFVIVDGMMRGVYTGRRLDQFVNGDKTDFFNARQIVNGHDCAQKIADQANAWLTQLS